MFSHTGSAAVARQRSGSLQGWDYHWSIEYDVLFETWAVADRLSLHRLAAQCEWALAQLWKEEKVYARAVRELSPGALQRIARSLCAGMEAARQQLQRVLTTAKGQHAAALLADVGEYAVATVSAAIMMDWREVDEVHAGLRAAQ